MNDIKTLMVLAAAAALSACGGSGSTSGSGSSGGDAATIPQSALASPNALVDWAREQPAESSEEPLALKDGLMLPKSDTDEPRDIT